MRLARGYDNVYVVKELSSLYYVRLIFVLLEGGCVGLGGFSP
jgi:hypothetical protein